FLDGDQLKGAIVWNGWNGANVDVTVWAPGIASRRILRGGFAYAFDGLGATRITAPTEVSNQTMRDLMRRLGFCFEARLPSYYGAGRDALQYSMLREDCPWLASSGNGRPRSPRPEGNRPSSGGDEQRNGDCPSEPEQRQSGNAAGLADIFPDRNEF